MNNLPCQKHESDSALELCSELNTMYPIDVSSTMYLWMYLWFTPANHWIIHLVYVSMDVSMIYTCQSLIITQMQHRSRSSNQYSPSHYPAILWFKLVWYSMLSVYTQSLSCFLLVHIFYLHTATHCYNK